MNALSDVQKFLLNSFVRRVAKADTLKDKIRSTGAVLSRKGRSRNWYLKADSRQILAIINIVESAGEESWFWLSKKLSENKQTLSYEDLLQLARELPNITLKKLIAMTDCKLVDARKVLDCLEWE